MPKPNWRIKTADDFTLNEGESLDDGIFRMRRRNLTDATKYGIKYEIMAYDDLPKEETFRKLCEDRVWINEIIRKKQKKKDKKYFQDRATRVRTETDEFVIPRQVLMSLDITYMEKIVFMVIYTFARKGPAEISASDIMGLSGLGLSSVSKAVRSLRDKGYLTYSQRWSGPLSVAPNMYRVPKFESTAVSRFQESVAKTNISHLRQDLKDFFYNEIIP